MRRDAQAEHAPRTSQLLRELAFSEGSARISFGEMVERLRHRSFGLATLVFAVPCMVPLPGLPTVCGVIIMVIAVQMLLGLPGVALPRSLARRGVSRVAFRRLVERALPYVQRLERVSRPRLLMMQHRLGEAMVGCVLLLLGFIVTLPIPIVGNVPPGIAAAIIAIGMSERDGLVVLIGVATTVLAFALSSAMVVAVIQSLLSAS